MAWSYRRRIKIIPGVHLNFSKSGISTSIGVKGVSLTLGKKGTFLNTSIPGLGIYNRQKLSGSSMPGEETIPGEEIQPELPLDYTPGLTVDNIFSANPQEITSQDMQGVKETILSAHEQRIDLANDLQSVKKSLSKSKVKLTISYVFLYGFINRAVSRKIKADISTQLEVLNQIQKQIEASTVQLDFEFEEALLESYESVVESFKRLCKSEKIWDVTSAYDQNRVVTRSAASIVVNKKEVSLAIKEIPDIKANFSPLYFQNGNGADVYFYPNFVIVYSSKQKFAIIGLNELRFRFSPVRFVQTGAVPGDSKIIDRTWAKVNKNGTPDRRFKDNFEIPIVRYGNIALQSATGLNEEYEFSNYEFADAFANAFLKYQSAIKMLEQI